MSNPPGRGPNIVIVHGHDTGRHFGCYGRGVSTPNVDRLANQGVQFTSAFTPSPQCSPSRAALATGRYPHRNGMLGLAHMGWSLNRPQQALPAQLRSLGYGTYLFGEQHEADEPATLGYDQAFATEWPQLAREVSGEFAARLSEIPRERPFFASVGFFEAHRPFDHPGYEDDSPDRVRVPPYLADTDQVRGDVAALNGRIKAVDDGLGVVLEALHATGLEADTLLIFTTDHGLAFPRAKGTLYDPGLETALIMRGPGSGEGGRVLSELTANVDLYPTLLEMAGGKVEADVDGRSLLPLLSGERKGHREALMCEMTWHDQYAPVRGVRTDRWKYIRRFGTPDSFYLPADVEDSPSGRAFRDAGASAPEREELFDLQADPDETRNLLGPAAIVERAGNEEVAAALRQRLDEWMRETNDPLLEERPR